MCKAKKSLRYGSTAHLLGNSVDRVCLKIKGKNEHKMEGKNNLETP